MKFRTFAAGVLLMESSAEPAAPAWDMLLPPTPLLG